jgi:transcriptional regulator with XRE-family HTH domain
VAILNKDIGAKIKQLRTQKQMTLKYMSEQTNLSIGFLSQLERGLTSVATDSLAKIADVLEVELTYFFMRPKERKRRVLRSYEKEVFDISNSMFIHYHLSASLKDKQLLPRLIEILPNKTDEEICSYIHEGEEFVYVLEGVLTVFLGDEQIDMYPGDSIHYDSEKNKHNWANYTNKMVKILVVSIPNPFREDQV